MILKFEKFEVYIVELLRKSELKTKVLGYLLNQITLLKTNRDHQDTSIKFSKDDLEEIVENAFPDDKALKDQLIEIVHNETFNDDVAKEMASANINHEIFDAANITNQQQIVGI